MANDQIVVGSFVQVSVSVDLDRTFDVDLRPFRARGNRMTGRVVEISAGTGYGARYRVSFVVGSAWYAPEELAIVEHETNQEAEGPAPPRIVCTKCPAVATVHYWEPRGHNYMIVWASCHGEHRWFGSVPIDVNDLIFGHQLGSSNHVAIRSDIESVCKSRGDDAARMLAQVKFLDAVGQPITPERFAPMRGDIERNLDFWQTLLTIAERKIGSKS